jgi:hypothetical protein
MGQNCRALFAGQWFWLRKNACLIVVEPFCGIGNQFSEKLKVRSFSIQHVVIGQHYFELAAA